MQLFGNATHRHTKGQNISLVADSILRKSVEAQTIKLAGVKTASIEPPLPQFDHILNANEFRRRGHISMKVSGRAIRIEPDQCYAAAHWVAPVAAYVAQKPNLYTLHDVIPLEYPNLVTHVGRQWAQLHETVIRHADAIITVSNYSRDRICKVLSVPEDRVLNTYQPVPPLPRITGESAQRLVKNIYSVQPGKYIFFCGAIEPKKNLYRLIEAFLTAKTDLKLLIAGPLGWLYDDVMELLRGVSATHPLTPTDAPVRWLGYLPRRHIVALLKCARFFAFPSISEGFGLPVVEAMQAGTPVLTSIAGSLPEVCGNAAHFVDPLDVAKMTEAIEFLSNDDDICDELSRRGVEQAALFTQENYERRLINAYEKVGIKLDMKTEASMYSGKQRPMVE